MLSSDPSRTGALRWTRTPSRKTPLPDPRSTISNPSAALAQLGVVAGDEQVGDHDVVVLGPADPGAGRRVVGGRELADGQRGGRRRPVPR